MNYPIILARNLTKNPRKAYFLHRMLPKMRRVPQEAFLNTECVFRTVEACFLHRMPPKMRRVPQEAFLSTARMFRTIGGPLRYRMPDTEAGCRRSEAWRTKKEADHKCVPCAL